MAKKKMTVRVDAAIWAQIEREAAAARQPTLTYAAALLEHQVSMGRISDRLHDVRVRLVQLQLLLAAQLPKERVEELRRRAVEYVNALDNPGGA